MVLTPDPQSPEVILRTPDLLVRAGPMFGGQVCIVTFTPFTRERTLDRPGFGEAFLESRQISAMHVISRTNTWFDYPQMDDALRRIADRVRDFERVVTYGSSMGGYAAIRFAEAIGAAAAIAISPQSGLGRRAAPFERRFHPESRRAGRGRHGSSGVVPYVFHDPLDEDALHARTIARAYPSTRLVPLLHAGHPAGAYLEETKLLSQAVIDIANDRFDPIAFAATARAARRGSSEYLATLAKRLAPAHAPTKMALMAMAIDLRDHAHHRCYLAALLEAKGDIAAAEAHLRRALDLIPDHTATLHFLALFLVRQRRLAEADAAVQRLIALWPENSEFWELAVEVAAATGKPWLGAPIPDGPPQSAADVLARAHWTIRLGLLAVIVRRFPGVLKARLWAHDVKFRMRWPGEQSRRKRLRRSLRRGDRLRPWDARR